MAANLRAVALQPDSADALNNLGNCYMAKNRAEEAVSAYRRALGCQASAVTACNLAHALRGLVRLDEAEHWFNEALRLDPAMTGAHNGLANTYRDHGEYAMAKDAYGRALALDPNGAEALHNLTVVLVEMGEIEEALAVARRAVAANPGVSSAHASLGRALAARHRHQETLTCYETGLGLDASNIDGLMLLAKSYEQLWLAERAAETYRRVLALAPGHLHALSMLINAVLSLCDWRAYRALNEQLAKRLAEATDREIDSLSIFNLQALPLPYATIARAARQSAAAIGRGVGSNAAVCRITHAPRENGRLRVGYLLPYTFRHSLPEVLKAIVERHDRNRFENIRLFENAGRRQRIQRRLSPRLRPIQRCRRCITARCGAPDQPRRDRYSGRCRRPYAVQLPADSRPQAGPRASALPRLFDHDRRRLCPLPRQRPDIHARQVRRALL